MFEFFISDSSIQLFFLRKVVRQNDTEVAKRSMQLEKLGSGLLREAYRREGECYVRRKRGGLIRKDLPRKMK